MTHDTSSSDDKRKQWSQTGDKIVLTGTSIETADNVQDRADKEAYRWDMIRGHLGEGPA